MRIGRTVAVEVSILSALGLLVACGPEAPAPTDGGGADAFIACASDAECDDGRFCNGAEACAPDSPSADARGCAPSTVDRCLEGQICDEAAESCTTECSVTEDADADGSRAIECGGDDCDDADAARAPTHAEICDVDGRDEDCDAATIGERDLDGDGATDELCCNGETCGEDCDDLRRGTNRDVPEVCDGFDNDCDGAIDEGVVVPVWPDTDFDLHGDRDAASEMRCAGAFGFAVLADDCDDDDPAVHPAQVEICDEKDNDCDDVVDEAPTAVTWYADADGDGYGSSDPTLSRVSCTPLPGFSLRPTDCDDTRGGVSPATPERCDGLDNDCNGRPDFLVGPRDTEDDDSDGHADLACPSGDDCDDRDPTSHPGALELCDARDNDCNGAVDDGTAMGVWWIDRDGDTYGDEGTSSITSCTFVRGRITRGGDCDDSSDARRPGASEVCDASDDDCDGAIDEGSPRAPYYLDVDGDGLGAGTPVLACVVPSDRVANASDCDDSSNSVGAARLWYVDADDDGWGDPRRVELACTMLADRINRGGDCDDTVATTYPMATEACGGGDEDCDGTIDEDPSASATCSIAGATAVCTGGSCAVGMCAAGLGDCNGALDDGCETALTTSPTSCGMCGRTCVAGERCRDGECARVTAIAAGYAHACALLGTGQVACWGANSRGQLGRGAASTSATPPPIDATQMVRLYTGAILDDVVSIAGHGRADHTCAVRATGDVVCWGSNDDRECGADAPIDIAPRAVPIPGITSAMQVVIGKDHACALLTSGAVRCWGANGSGQLVSGTTSAPSGTPLVAVERDGAATRPIADAIQISAGNTFTCILHAGGTQVSCAGQSGSGAGWSGQLGRTPITYAAHPVAEPVALPTGVVIAEIISGASQSYDSYTCARPVTGSPLCWGINASGQMGAGGSSVTTPRAIDPLLFADSTEVFVGLETICVSYDNASFGPRVACLGENASGELGIGTTASASTPFDMITTDAGGTQAPLTDVQQIVGGRQFSCALLTSGAVTCWGTASALFGDGTTASRRTVQIDSPVPRIP
ncbi:MAG: MopE-related protein [Myxococcota bacterium]|nr:MopE-related protein [Myxococcota bacterium]